MSPQDAREPRHEPAGADWTPGPRSDRDTQVKASARPEHAAAFPENLPQDRRKVGAPWGRSPLLECTLPDHAIKCLVPIGQRTRAGACRCDMRCARFATRGAATGATRAGRVEMVDELEVPPPCRRRCAPPALNVKSAFPARQICNPEPVAPGMVGRPRSTLFRLRRPGRLPCDLSPRRRCAHRLGRTVHRLIGPRTVLSGSFQRIASFGANQRAAPALRQRHTSAARRASGRRPSACRSNSAGGVPASASRGMEPNRFERLANCVGEDAGAQAVSVSYRLRSGAAATGEEPLRRPARARHGQLMQRALRGVGALYAAIGGRRIITTIGRPAR